MGVVPQQSPIKLLKVWSPIAKYLSDVTGQKIVFKTEKSIPKFEKELYAGKYDFAYMNPYHYVIANKKQAYEAAVRSTKNINGILVMKKGQNLDSLKAKKTKYIFPAPNAFAATLLTKYDLVQKFGVSIEDVNSARYVNSHDSVYKGIDRGIADVGGGIERTYKNLNAKAVKENIHVVHKTQPYPSHPFAFKPSMDTKLKAKITKALLDMPKELLALLSVKKLKKIEHSEYKSVEDLALKLNLITE